MEALEAINGGVEPGVLFEVLGRYAPKPGPRFVRGRGMTLSEPSAGTWCLQKLNNDLHKTTLEHVSGVLLGHAQALIKTEEAMTRDELMILHGLRKGPLRMHTL